jgi:hypothetical protein
MSTGTHASGPRALDTRSMSRRVRWVIGCLVILLVVPVAVAAGSWWHSTTKVERARDHAAASLSAAFPEGRRLAEEQRTELRRSQRLPAPVASWQQLVCQVDTVDAGWVIESWEQVCYLRTVDVFAAAGGPQRCRSLQPAGSVDPDWEFSLAGVFPMTSDRLAQGHWRERCPSDVAGLFPEDPVTVAVSGSPPTDLPPGRRWVVARINTPLTSDEIGCAPLSFMCGQPGGLPVVPESLVEG